MAPNTRMAEQPVVSPDRLFAAANELLRAIGSPEGFDAEVSMHTGPLPVGISLSGGVFSSEELIEAMALLIRLGLVPSTNSGAGRADHLQSLPARRAG